MAKYQIRKLKNRDLNHALEIQLLESENESLERRIRGLQIQLKASQEQLAENEILLREKDAKIAEYVAQINSMDNDLNSDQGSSRNPACPLCFKEMSRKTSEKTPAWVEVEPCGHRTCLECFDKLNKERDEILSGEYKFTSSTCNRYVKGYICSICDEPANNALLDDGETRLAIPNY